MSSTLQTTPRDRAAIIATLPPELPTNAWLTVEQVLLFFPFSRSQLYRMVKRGDFDAPEKNGRLSVWHSRTIRKLLDRGPRSTRGKRARRAS
jgi:predicted DNA-binding transcriptional regulator AlpA